jgi:pimeloyl-ACP methyl ester carboxylesterase
MSGRAARTFPNCRIVVLPRVGHVAMMERPDVTAAEIREFLRRTAAWYPDDRAALGAVGR